VTYILFVVFCSECSFVTKAVNAEHAGAVAVIIADNDISNDETLIDMTDDDTHRPTRIPAFFLLGKDGFVPADK